MLLFDKINSRAVISVLSLPHTSYIPKYNSKPFLDGKGETPVTAFALFPLQCTRCKPLFISQPHSIGGIFVKYVLLLALSYQKYSSVRESVRGVAFFGTPHNGFSEDASMETVVRTIADRLSISQCLAVPTPNANSFKMLPFRDRFNDKSMSLQGPQRAWAVQEHWVRHYWNQVRIFCFYETGPAVS